MKKSNTYLKILLVFLISFSGFYEAQQSMLTAGNNAQSGTGNVSYSVGQIFYISQQAATGNVNLGVQQPYEITVLATQENAIPNAILFYPNPVKDFLIIDLNSEKVEKPYYQLYDSSGKILSKGNLGNRKTEINTSTLSSGLYLLTITSGGKTVKTFKIIKK